MEAKMLAPAAVLIVWTMIVMLWMTVTRFAATGKAGIDLTKAKPGSRGASLDGVLPDPVMWKSHNYTHLLEQPTIFYPAVVIIAVMGASPSDVLLAWAYVALRIVHSFWQAMVNRLPLRIVLFFVSSVILVVLACRAAMLTLFAV
jgi:hypothetical protein